MLLGRSAAVLPRVTFALSPVARPCGCPGPLRLRRTRRRRIASLVHGRFVAVEKTGCCPAHRSLPAVRSRDLARLVPAGGTYACDLIVRVGIAHFLECRQLEEIQADLATRFALAVPVRTLGHLARVFVAYVQVVHHESVPLLRRDMRRRGGYVLHVDGTCEEGSRVLLVCMDSVSDQVLDSKKIGSENTVEVRGVLEGIRDEWGVPLSTVHDLRQTILAATAEVFPDVPQFVCHFHFAADVGKDILGPGVDRLRKLFRDVKLRPKLGAVARSLREFAVDAGGAHVLSALLDGASLESRKCDLPEGTGLGVVHGLVSWVLAYSRAGRGYGFPFDIPYLDLYERVRRILATVVEGERAPDFADGAVRGRCRAHFFRRESAAVVQNRRPSPCETSPAYPPPDRVAMAGRKSRRSASLGTPGEISAQIASTRVRCS